MKNKSIYRHLVNPEDYSLFSERPVKVVTRKQIDNKIQFTTLRMFAIDRAARRIVDFKKEIDIYTVHQKLGNVLWPFCDTLSCENLAELAEEVKARGLFLFDFWGFVPGSWSSTMPWGEFEIKTDAVSTLTQTLEDHFLGFDNGEQDGRYVGGYAPMMCPATPDRREQYLNFQRHFEKLSDSMRHHITALCSLHYGHYFLKENDVILLGSECAQALPNVNLWYSFIRGAGRQYGVLWFGNASIWNRWGYKNYSQRSMGDSNSDNIECGPEYGTSLSLLRRILYTHYTYNCDILGYEGGWLYEKNAADAPGGEIDPHEFDIMAGDYVPPGDKLTPIGTLQSDAVAFVEKQGYPGAMHTPVAVLLDFFAGYTPPRHLYTKNVYQTWGALPYDEGDYQTHALFNEIFPGYEDAGFYRDERGFLVATPYGDMFDVLLSDADGNVLKSYNRIVLSGSFGMGAEEFDKLRSFVLDGGTANVFLGVVDQSLMCSEQEKEELLSFFGLKSIGQRLAYEGGSSIVYSGCERRERAFELYDICLDEQAEVVARAGDGRPAIYEIAQGQGKVCVVVVPFGINRTPHYDFNTTGESTTGFNVENRAVPMPFDLLDTVKAYLGDCFNREKLVDINPALGSTVNLLAENKLLLTVANNGNCAQRFDIHVRAGTLTQVEELCLKAPATDTAGYYPFVYAEGPAQGAGNYRIEPLDIRMFRLTVEAMGLDEKEKITVADRTAKRYLKLKPGSTIREQIAMNPTMDAHFAGVKVDARYLMEREESVLAQEAGYVKRRAMSVIVDFSSLMNHYPDISLLDNIAGRYQSNLELIARTLGKAMLYGCTKAVISLHRNAENHIAPEDADACFARTIGIIAGQCKERGITLYVQNGTPARRGFLMKKLIDWIDSHGLDVKVAWNIGHSLCSGEDLEDIARDYGNRISALLLSAPARDIHGQFADTHAPLHLSAFGDAIARAAGNFGDAVDFVALDAGYADFGQAYRDIKCLRRARG